MQPTKVLVLGPEGTGRTALERTLVRLGYAVSASDARRGAASEDADILMLDLRGDEADWADLAPGLQQDDRPVMIVSERPREGWSVVNEQGETVALDLELTPELVRAGLAREAVRLVQEARKNSGFEVSDRVVLRWAASGETAEAMREHADLVADEVLAVEMAEVASIDGDNAVRDDDLGLAFTVAKA